MRKRKDARRSLDYQEQGHGQGVLPPHPSLATVKLHCSTLAEDAVKAALADYKPKQEPEKGEGEKEGALSEASSSSYLLCVHPPRHHYSCSEAPAPLQEKSSETRAALASHVAPVQAKYTGYSF